MGLVSPTTGVLLQHQQALAAAASTLFLARFGSAMWRTKPDSWT
ncbi:hypothetical protein PC129_g11708 [Phytophthora cactorum]|uniref:Uncharacterized protein n=1 Tax=Phytophthora cactorum TaxID=29920 RepID=A0A8T1L835_9STRA|nr:hypothetical protein Pcac1_g12446 [Phytophthora cactorum]KAG3114162.1 hypothetical protein PI125_g6707 [Phytophthora idaei]KAG2898449.1 hypothetical protein PC114_g14276 [Phytophthora cactorum]KAG2911425.1 hypothetical protein PC115_g12577 [Phytophthora cactorum]KAG2941060.1 hypothetical protein PC117_g10344 [Phytophthora cactorum]